MKFLTIVACCIFFNTSLKSQNVFHTLSAGLSQTGLDVDLRQMQGSKRNEGFKNSKLGFGLNYSLELSIIKKFSALSGFEYKVNRTSFTRMHIQNNSNPEKPVNEHLKFTRFIVPLGAKYYALKNERLSVSAYGGISLILMNLVKRDADFYQISFPSLAGPATHTENINSKFNENEAPTGLAYLAGIGATFNVGEVILTADLQYRKDISKSRFANIPLYEEKGYFFTELKWIELNFGIRL